MDFFSPDFQSVVNPREMVMAFTLQEGEASAALLLETLALVTFTSQDLRRLVQLSQQVSPIEAWRNRNSRIYRGEGWIVVQAPYGAPGTIMLLEELVAFGVRRIVLLGYCGAIQKGVSIGDVILPMEAIREEGTSYHYLPEGEKSSPDPKIQKKLSDWMGRMGLSFHEEPFGQRMLRIVKRGRKSGVTVRKAFWEWRWRWRPYSPLEGQGESRLERCFLFPTKWERKAGILVFFQIKFNSRERE